VAFVFLSLRPFATETPGQGEILWLNGDTLSVDGSQVGVLEEGDKISLGGLLEGHDCGGLEAQIGLEILSDFTNEALEGELPDEQFRRLLVPPNFTEGDGTGPEAMGLLDTTSRGGGGLPGSLSCELLTRGLASGGLAGGLLGAGHC